MLKRFVSKILQKEREFYQQSVDALFDRDLNRDINVFQKLYPNDDFGRSIAQHMCQVYPFKKDIFKLNCMSAILIPVIVILFLLKKRSRVKDDNSTIVCYYCFNLPGSLPEAFQEQKISFLTSEDCPYYLNRKDIAFLLRFFFRSFWHPFLSFRVLLKVAKYRAIIDSFSKLKVIAITGEFSDTSSAMTQYCHENDIKHYNFMQGDMFGCYRTAFFHFDKCFVWDKYYVKQFVDFGAVPEQFEVSLPQCLQKIEENQTEKKIDYIYYLGGYPDEDLTTIQTAIDKLVEKGYVCEVRPHPHWSNMALVNRVFQGITIQDTNSVSVDKSLLLTKNAIGLCSTVLLQAHYNEVNVVIDDLSSPAKYKMLEGYQYIMLNKQHKLLSEITKR